MEATVVVPICGTPNSWKVAETSDPKALTEDRRIFLEIKGDAENGYHLIMSPVGCFTAGSWHPTIDDALDTAFRLFGVQADSWR